MTMTMMSLESLSRLKCPLTGLSFLSCLSYYELELKSLFFKTQVTYRSDQTTKCRVLINSQPKLIIIIMKSWYGDDQMMMTMPYLFV